MFYICYSPNVLFRSREVPIVAVLFYLHGPFSHMDHAELDFIQGHNNDVDQTPYFTPSNCKSRRQVLKKKFNKRKFD